MAQAPQAPVPMKAATSIPATKGGKAGRDMTAAEALASMPPPPLPPQATELSASEKAAKDKLENPTVDQNGEHI